MSTQANISAPGDSGLVNRILAGERAVEFELDRRWRDRLFALARTILHDDHLAEDAAQIAMWRVLRNLGQYKPSQPFEKWILAIGRHTALDLLRRKQARPEGKDAERLEDCPAPGHEGHARAASHEELEALRHCLATIRNENRRQTIQLNMAGLSLSETGRMLARSKSVIQDWLQAAIEHLRRCMASRGFSGL